MSSNSTILTVPLRAGLLGAGVIAAGHASALRLIPGVELIAVCDRDLQKATQLQTQFGIPQVFDDVGQMLRTANLDVVHILLPPSVHAEAAIECLRANCHVFVEKPFTLSTAEGKRTQAVAEHQGKTIGVNHNLTYLPGMLRLIEEVKRYRVGAVEHVTVVYNLPMPALAAGQHGHWMLGDTNRLILELAPHPVSVICRLVGEVQEAATVVSGGMVLKNGKQFYDTWQSSLVCTRGTGQLFLSVGRDYLNTWVHLVGEDGEIFVDLRRNTVRLSEKTKYLRMDNLIDSWRNGKETVRASLGTFVRQTQGALGLKPPFDMQSESMNMSILAYYEALLNDWPVPVGAAEGLTVVRGCEAIIESALGARTALTGRK